MAHGVHMGPGLVNERPPFSSPPSPSLARYTEANVFSLPAGPPFEKRLLSLAFGLLVILDTVLALSLMGGTRVGGYDGTPDRHVST